MQLFHLLHVEVCVSENADVYILVTKCSRNVALAHLNETKPNKQQKSFFERILLEGNVQVVTHIHRHTNAYTCTPSVFICGRTKTALGLSRQSHCTNTFKQISTSTFQTLSIPSAIKANMMNWPPLISSETFTSFHFGRMNKSIFMAGEDITVLNRGTGVSWPYTIHTHNLQAKRFAFRINWEIKTYSIVKRIKEEGIDKKQLNAIVTLCIRAGQKPRTEWLR